MDLLKLLWRSDGVFLSKRVNKIINETLHARDGGKFLQVLEGSGLTCDLK